MKLKALHQDPDSSSEKKEDEEQENQDNFNLDQLSSGNSMPDRGPDQKHGDIRKHANLPPFNS